MKLRKTKQTERNTYTYTFTDVDKNGRYFTRTQTLRPGENGVTEKDIKELHRLDDIEVYNNIKNIRPQKTVNEKNEQLAWVKQFKSDFFREYGYEPTKDIIEEAISVRYPKNWNLSIDYFLSEDDGTNTSDYCDELIIKTSFSDDEISPEIRRMRDIVSKCTEKQQLAYQLVFIEGYTETEAAIIMNCTHQCVHKHLNLLKKKIKENF